MSGTYKVVYMGLPGVLCENSNCGYLSGPASYVFELVSMWALLTGKDGKEGAICMIYEGSYWTALRKWILR